MSLPRLPKPEFQFGGSLWVNEGFIPPEVATRLAEHLPDSLTDQQKAELLRIAAVEAQVICEITGKWNTPAATQKAELVALASNARSLLQAMRKLSPGSVSAFQSNWDYLALAGAPPVQLHHESRSMRRAEGQFLGAVWDAVEDLESSAHYAADQIQLSRQDQKSKAYARGLVRKMAAAYRRLTLAHVPYSKNTWFPAFMAELGQLPCLQLACGQALVESVCKEMREQPD